MMKRIMIKSGQIVSWIYLIVSYIILLSCSVYCALYNLKFAEIIIIMLMIGFGYLNHRRNNRISIARELIIVFEVAACLIIGTIYVGLAFFR